ncbi:MAG: cell division protein ZapA [Flavobacteriales bacterium]|nr:cell division protein ZapA [Flavobacteriales bacterium]
MSDLSIKVSIAGRVYPLTIKREEEESVRKAARLIDESVRLFQQNYAVKDKQDLLAMTALQLATRSEEKEGSPSEDIAKALREAEAVLDRALS